MLEKCGRKHVHLYITNDGTIIAVVVQDPHSDLQGKPVRTLHKPCDKPVARTKSVSTTDLRDSSARSGTPNDLDHLC